MRNLRAGWLLLGWLGLLLGGGCAGSKSFLNLNWSGKKIPEASAENPVVRMVCIWEPAEGRGLDGLPTRGFAGQIMFFTAGEATPVRADGNVRIYLYDEGGLQAQQAKPLHQFDYLNGAWTTHLRLGMLGPVYQVFIPYVRKHPYRAKCALRVRFQPDYGGPPVYSEVVSITLPGPEPKQADKEKKRQESGTKKPQLSIRRFSLPLTRGGAVNQAGALGSTTAVADTAKATSPGSSAAGQVSPQRVQELLQRLRGHRLRPRQEKTNSPQDQPAAASAPGVLSRLSAPGPVVLSPAGDSTRGNGSGRVPETGDSAAPGSVSRRFQLRPAQ